MKKLVSSFSAKQKRIFGIWDELIDALFLSL
jgi:hypothetical protein